MVFDSRRSDNEPSGVQPQQHTDESDDGKRDGRVERLLAAWVLATVEHRGSNRRSSLVAGKCQHHIVGKGRLGISAEVLCRLCAPEEQYTESLFKHQLSWGANALDTIAWSRWLIVETRLSRRGSVVTCTVRPTGTRAAVAS